MMSWLSQYGNFDYLASIVASFACASLIIVDIITKELFGQRRDKMATLISLFQNTVLIVANMLIISNMFSLRSSSLLKTRFFWIVWNTRDYIIGCSFWFQIRTSIRNHQLFRFGKRLLSSAVFSFSVCISARAFSCGFSSNTNNIATALGIVSAIAGIVTVFQLLGFASCFWYKVLHLKRVWTFLDMSPLYVSALWCMGIIALGILSPLFDVYSTYDVAADQSVGYSYGSAYLTVYTSLLQVLVLMSSLVCIRLSDFYIIAESEEVLKTKERFVRYVSREIRSPLQLISMTMEILKRRLFEVKKRLRTIAIQQKQQSEQPQDELLQSATRRRSLLTRRSVMLTLSPASLDVIAANINAVDEVVYETALACSHACSVLEELIESGGAAVGEDAGGDCGASEELYSDNIVEDLVRESVEMFKLLVKATGSVLVIEYASSTARAVALNVQKARISQVIGNLVSNAIKFSPKGSSVVLRVAIVDESGNEVLRWDLEEDAPRRVGGPYVRVTVKDQGAGISTENQAKLFKGIVQFNPNKNQNGGGSGIGLMMSYSLVKEHGGNMGVFSEGEGCGSEFWIELPLGKGTLQTIRKISMRLKSYSNSLKRCEESQSKSPKWSSRYSHSSPKALKRGLHVLCVDDLPNVCKLLCRTLAANDICLSPDVAADGEEAVSKVMESMCFGKPYDLILMDYFMPCMDGPTATIAIREIGFNGLIFGCTSNAVAEDLSYFKSCGADQMLVKPIDVTQLRKLLKDYEMEEWNADVGYSAMSAVRSGDGSQAAGEEGVKTEEMREAIDVLIHRVTTAFKPLILTVVPSGGKTVQLLVWTVTLLSLLVMIIPSVISSIAGENSLSLKQTDAWIEALARALSSLPVFSMALCALCTSLYLAVGVSGNMTFHLQKMGRFSIPAVVLAIILHDILYLSVLTKNHSDDDIDKSMKLALFMWSIAAARDYITSIALLLYVHSYSEEGVCSNRFVLIMATLSTVYSVCRTYAIQRNTSSSSLFTSTHMCVGLMLICSVITATAKLWKCIQQIRSGRIRLKLLLESERTYCYAMYHGLLLFIDLWYISVTATFSVVGLSNHVALFTADFVFGQITVFCLLSATTLLPAIERAKLENTVATKRTLVRHVSHEIRTPLNIVNMGAQYLLNHVLNEFEDTLRKARSLHGVFTDIENLDSSAAEIEMNIDSDCGSPRATAFFSELRENCCLYRADIVDVRASCAVAISVLNDILLYEKIDGEALELDRSLVRPSELFKRAFDDFSSAAAAENRNEDGDVVLDLKMADLVDTESALAIALNADQAKLVYAINNLLSFIVNNFSSREAVKLSVTIDPVRQARITWSGGSLESKESAGSLSKLVSSSSSNLLKRDFSLVTPYPGQMMKPPTHVRLIINFDLTASLSENSDANPVVEPLQVFSKGNSFNRNLRLFVCNGILAKHGGSLQMLRGDGHTYSAMIRLPISAEKLQLLPQPIAEGLASSSQSIQRPAGASMRRVVPVLGAEALPVVDPQHITTPPCIEDPANLRVLCVDDSASSLKMTSRLLVANKICEKPDTAENGEEALKMIILSMSSSYTEGEGDKTSRPYELVLMDSQMPVLDGPTATKMARDAGFRGLVFGLTGNAAQEDVQQFLEMGADEVIVKPFDINNLRTLISKYMAFLLGYNIDTVNNMLGNIHPV